MAARDAACKELADSFEELGFTMPRGLAHILFHVGETRKEAYRALHASLRFVAKLNTGGKTPLCTRRQYARLSESASAAHLMLGRTMISTSTRVTMSQLETGPMPNGGRCPPSASCANRCNSYNSCKHPQTFKN